MNEDIATYARRLERRYRRFFKFDLILSVLYALTAVLPIWAVVTGRGEFAFHAFGAFSILLVGILGIESNRRLLDKKRFGFLIGIIVTVALIATRVTILVMAYSIFARQFEGYDIDVRFGYFISEWIVPIAYIVFVIGGYRFFYHMSAFYYSRLFLADQEMAEPGGALNRMG